MITCAFGCCSTEAVRLLLAAGIDPSQGLPAEALAEWYAPDPPIGAVHAAVQFQCAPEMVALLLQAGADPAARGQDGRSAHQRAVRRGDTELATLLRVHGADDDATDADRFLSACVRADRAAADRVVARVPGLRDELTAADHEAITFAADHGDVAAVALMLDLGFPRDAPVGEDGATPLHAAAGAGAVDLVAFLLEHGADIEATDATWSATPLCWATVGSGLRLGHAPNADWVATVRTLIAAGASTGGVWVAGKPPGDDVAAVLHAYGVDAPEEEDSA